LSGKYEQEIEVKGHLIDSLILTNIFDKVMDLKGDFHVLEFNVGKRKRDQSYARLLVRGKNEQHLYELLEAVYREGAQPISVQQVMLEPAVKDMVMPDSFYSTTNNATQVYYNGTWKNDEKMMMDKSIVLDKEKMRAE
jgi:hypothetical protein